MQKRVKECMQIFTKFLQKILLFDYVTFLHQAQNIYAVRQFKISQLTIQSATQMYQNILYKFSRNWIHQVQLNWWENQLRIFVWALILYVKVNQLTIQTLKQNDWEFFSIIFPNKKLILFQYQSINILKEHGQAKKWIPDEDIIFGNLVKEKGLKCKWSELAKLLYIQSDRLYFRTPKQCRQRWLNHLDPSKSKSQWTLKQDYILIRHVYEKEKKWAEISKLLGNKRNEHSIKNRFKSLITKQQKFHSQKLQQSELIPLVYQRYTNYFENKSKNEEQMEEYPQIEKKQQKQKNQEKIKTSLNRNSLQEHSNNFSLKKQNQSQDKNSYAFGWISQQKKSSKNILINNNSQLMIPASDKSYLSYTSHIQNFDERNFQQKTDKYQINQTFIYPKVKTLNQIPFQVQENYLTINRFHSLNMIPHPSNQYEYNYNSLPNSPDSPDSPNDSDFFPSYDIDLRSQSSEIQQEKINSENYYSKNMFNKKTNVQIDQQQQQIRAQILLAEDPFDLLKPYFYNFQSNAFII